MSIAAHDLDDRIGQIIILTERLTDLIAAETRAFEANRPQDVAATVGETAKLANIYRMESTRLKRDPSLLQGANLKQRVALVRATEAFDAVLARHGRVLESAKSITEGLVQAIAKEVATTRVKAAGYTALAKATPVNGTAITLNKRA